MSETYYVRLRGRIQGPFDRDQLRRLVQRGQLGRFHDMSQDKNRWFKAAEFPELFDNLPATGPRAYQATAEHASAEPGAGETQSTDWFYAIGEEQVGPLDLAALLDLVRNGTLGADDHCWAEELANWMPVSNVPQLAACLPNSPHATTKPAQVREASLAHPGAKRLAVGFAFAVLFLLVIVSGVAVWQTISRDDSGVRAMQSEIGSVEGDNTPLTSIEQTGSIDESVGKVAWGFEIVTRSGIELQIPMISGSAFAINTEGYMLTNAHVVADFKRMTLADEDVRKTFFASFVKKEERADILKNVKTIDARLWVFVDFEKHQASVEFVHPRHDVAILKLDHNFNRYYRLLGTVPEKLMDVEVRAIGFPGIAKVVFSQQEGAKKTKYTSDAATIFEARHLQYVMTQGRVSQVTRDSATKLYWLQHTATISHGNSGGPLVDVNAVVVGVNTEYAGDKAAVLYRSFCLAQVRREIDRHVSGVKWVDQEK